MIKCYMGPMFSRKTSTMMIEADKLRRGGKKVVFLRAADDNRYDKSVGRNVLVCSHDGLKKEGYAVKDLLLMDETVLGACYEADVICIDEGHFLLNLKEFCEKMATDYGKYVIVAALDSDFRRAPFKNMPEFMACCEKVKKLHAVCQVCGSRASFTKKIAGSLEEVLDVGGDDKYVPVCRTHFFDKTKE